MSVHVVHGPQAGSRVGLSYKMAEHVGTFRTWSTGRQPCWSLLQDGRTCRYISYMVHRPAAVLVSPTRWQNVSVHFVHGPQAGSRVGLSYKLAEHVGTFRTWSTGRQPCWSLLHVFRTCRYISYMVHRPAAVLVSPTSVQNMSVHFVHGPQAGSRVGLSDKFAEHVGTFRTWSTGRQPCWSLLQVSTTCRYISYMVHRPAAVLVSPTSWQNMSVHFVHGPQAGSRVGLSYKLAEHVGTFRTWSTGRQPCWSLLQVGRNTKQ